MGKEKNYGSNLCGGKLKGGGTCKRKVVHGLKCWIHSQSEDHLRVKQSGIKGAGRGLFVTKPVHKSKIIAKFKGPIISDETRETYSPEHQADCVEIDKDHWMDSHKTNSCYARYANEASKLEDRNADLVAIQKSSRAPWRPALEAKKEIPAGTEVKTDYGPSYPRQYPHWRRQTTNWERNRGRRG